MRGDDVRQASDREVGHYRAGSPGEPRIYIVRQVQLVRNLPHDKTVFLKYGCISNATVEVVMS